VEPQIRAWNKWVKLLTHTPFTQSLKQSVPTFPKILACSSPSWPESHRSQRKGTHHPGYASGFSRSPAEDQPMPVPYTDYPGASYLVWTSSMNLRFTPPVWGPSLWFHSPLQSSEGDPGITPGVRTSRFQGSPQAAEPGSRDPLPSGAQRSDLTGASTNVGRMSDQWEQYSNPGGWRKGRFITLAGHTLDLSKNGTGPVAQGCGVFMRQNVEASKREGQNQTWQLASHWEVTTYHTSTRLQFIT
jgi:hypothetical protein